mgnify:FL=1
MNLRDPITMVGQKVNSEGSALVRAITETGLEFTSANNSDAYAYCTVVYDPSAGDTILAVRNDSKTNALYPVRLVINNGATASSYDIHVITASFTAAGTTVVPVNLNTKGSVNPDITAIADETGNTQGTLLETVFMAADSRREIDLLGLTLAQGHTVAVDMTEDGASGEQSITIIAHH